MFAIFYAVSNRDYTGAAAGEAIQRAIAVGEGGVTAAQDGIYTEMHKMINTKIVAEDGEVWGEILITIEKCYKVIKDVNETDYVDKDILLQYLANWKAGDFTHAVAEHNYLWGALDGTVGRAKSLRT
ncbi:MAG TPA: DUF6241 domain-containing protein [Desulfosporosinus sp.]|nr:DUF6241 domain-containing protein [Desulfosporosinus sp.]